jgi:hypothetical protein
MKNKSQRPNNLLGKSGNEPAHKEISFSFRDFDHTQGQTFFLWEKESLLGKMLDKLKEYSKKSIPEARKANFTVYGSFPANSAFKHPKYITDDAVWASMHIQGKECIAGHLVGNIFYIVFLDKEHQFWPTEKKQRQSIYVGKIMKME